MNWLERARREIAKYASTSAANSAERNLMAVLAVPNPEICEKSKGTDGAPAELEERQALAAGSVPEPYLDGWSRLQLQRPAAIPGDHWRQAVDAAGRFLDEWGNLAEIFRWSPDDLFNVPRDGRPGGLVWFLQGETVRALGPDHAITMSERVFDRMQRGSHGS
jgi:hypothetical protein